jgi:hypothetical protein
MTMDERQFFTEKTESHPQSLSCPMCKTVADYQIRWTRRTKKPSLPGGGDADDRARFMKARDYMIRLDDMVSCSKCRRRIEINSKSVVLL